MTFPEHTADSSPPAAQPEFTQPRLILFVFLGGALGTLARESVGFALAANGGIPWAVLIVNLVGALLLGFLLAALGSRVPETPPRRDWRVLAGTGLLGGFTTYSALATDTALLIESQPFVGISYAVGSVIAGLTLAAVGVRAGALIFPPPAAGAKA